MRARGTVSNLYPTIVIQLLNQAASQRRRKQPKKAAAKKKPTGSGFVPFTGVGRELQETTAPETTAPALQTKRAASKAARQKRVAAMRRNLAANAAMQRMAAAEVVAKPVRRSVRSTRPTARAAEHAAVIYARIAGLAFARNARIQRNVRVAAKQSTAKIITPKDRSSSGGGEGDVEAEPGSPIGVQVGGMVIGGGGTVAYIMADNGNNPLEGGKPFDLDELDTASNYREAVHAYNADHKIEFGDEAIYRAHGWLRPAV